MAGYQTTIVRMPIKTYNAIKNTGGPYSELPWRYCAEDAVVVTAPDEKMAQEIYFWAWVYTDKMSETVRRY